ncbi:MAG: hypothetical protein JRE57_05500 [Deltaproteobacteria bacterium]|nr:hypothetical protein [Deltaproteobacteria bacterium]
MSGGLGFFAPQIALLGIAWLLGMLGYAGSCVIGYPLGTTRWVNELTGMTLRIALLYSEWSL